MLSFNGYQVKIVDGEGFFNFLMSEIAGRLEPAESPHFKAKKLPLPRAVENRSGLARPRLRPTFAALKPIECGRRLNLGGTVEFEASSLVGMGFYFFDFSVRVNFRSSGKSQPELGFGVPRNI